MGEANDAFPRPFYLDAHRHHDREKIGSIDRTQHTGIEFTLEIEMDLGSIDRFESFDQITSVETGNELFPAIIYCELKVRNSEVGVVRGELQGSFVELYADRRRLFGCHDLGLTQRSCQLVTENRGASLVILGNDLAVRRKGDSVEFDREGEIVAAKMQKLVSD